MVQVTEAGDKTMCHQLITQIIIKISVVTDGVLYLEGVFSSFVGKFGM